MEKSEIQEEVLTIKENSVGNSFLEFLTITVQYRWFLFWFVFVITISASTYALLSPKWYRATASVLPAQNTDFLSAFTGLSSLAKNLSASKGLAALTGNTEFDKYIVILRSATMTDDVIRKFGLQKEYEMEHDYYDKVVKELHANMDLNVSDEGNLNISIYDKNPQKAADIVNYMIGRLNEINTNISITNAKANREFIEKRYFSNISDINNLEAEMLNFQKKYGVIAVPQQLEASVKSMASIYAELAQKEIEFNVLKRTYGENSPLVNNASITVQEYKNKIKNMNAGTDNSQNASPLISMKQAPDLANKYLKIYQDLQIQYKILEFVQPIYEQAKVEEVRQTPSVLVLDRATPPDRKEKPKVSLYALTSFVASMVVGYFIVFFVVLLQKMKQIEPQKYSYISSSIKKDLSRIGIGRRK